eukprot:jgi/Botrbrau1/6654/Bobra.0202s0002.1
MSSMGAFVAQNCRYLCGNLVRNNRNCPTYSFCSEVVRRDAAEVRHVVLHARKCRLTSSETRRSHVHRTCAPAAQVEAETADATPALDVTKLDIRVGKILSIEQHPDADSLYVETVDLGEEEPRTIVSGLVKYVPLEAMQGRMVIALCNLKPRNMRGIKSNGMLLCASDAAHENVEPLDPPAGAVVGERVFFGDDGASQPEPLPPNQIQKKKVWEEVQPELKTDAGGVAVYRGVAMLTTAGAVRAASLTGANVS